jgi:PAS domain S-box-containing protein
MLPLRPSVRTVTIIVMLAALAVAAALAYVLYLSGQHRSQTNDRVKLEIAQIARYEDAQIGLANQGSDLATYYAIRGTQYAQSFEEARAQTDQALVTARAAAPSLGAAEVTRLDDLLGRYRNVSDAEERVLQAVQRDDVAGALAITGQTDLIDSSPKLTLDVQQTVEDARAALSVAQRQDTTAQSRSFAFSLGIAISWAAILFLLGLAMFRWLVRPLERVSLTTQAIAGGDLLARVPETGPRELAKVGGDVNRMAEALIRRSDELNAYLAKHLEARTEQLEARTEELEASEQRFRALVQHGSDLITVIEADGTIVYQSPSIERMLGYAAVDIVGRKLTELTHRDDVHHVASFITDAMKLQGTANSAAVRLRALDGAWIHVEIVGTDHRDDAAVRGLVLNLRDVSERHALEEQLRFEAFHDPLTQLANRAQFTDRLAHALDRRGPSSHSTGGTVPRSRQLQVSER